MITQKQLNNIRRLSVDDRLLIMRECANSLMVVSVDEYCRITMKGKRATYYNIIEDKIKSFEISRKKYPCINS